MRSQSKTPPPKPKIKLPSRVLLVHTAPDLRFLAKAFRLSKKGRFFLMEIYVGEGKALCGPVLGAPQAAIALEYLKAAGVKEVLALGWAGALEEELLLGSIFLPEKGLSAEGTSAHYGYYPYPAEKVFAWLCHELALGGFFFETGAVLSTDALFRETEELLARFPEARVIDMETSALFSVARALGLSLASLLVISDRLVPRYERLEIRKIRKSLGAILSPLEAFFRVNF